MNPKKVNREDSIIKIVDARNMLLVIYFIPIPSVKESNDTKNANINMFMMLSSCSLFSSFNDFIISISIKIKIVSKIYLLSRLSVSVMMLPSSIPKIGIIKWKIPTVMDVDI